MTATLSIDDEALLGMHSPVTAELNRYARSVVYIQRGSVNMQINADIVVFLDYLFLPYTL